MRSHAEQLDQGSLDLSNSRHQSAVVAFDLLDEKPGALAGDTRAPPEGDDARGGVDEDGSRASDVTSGQHGVEAGAAVEGVPCPDCSQVFTDVVDLQGHLDVVHMELLPLERVHELARLLEALSTEGGSEDPSPRED